MYQKAKLQDEQRIPLANLPMYRREFVIYP